MTIFKNIYKVKPGEIVEFDINRNFEIISSKFIGKLGLLIITNLIKVFFQKFNTINLRKEADVDVAALLSKEIDSTSIVKSLVNHLKR